MNRIRTVLASLLIGGALALAAATAQAQEPQKVPRLVDEQMSHEWYVTQRDLWRKALDRDPRNADAWFNYYKAVRYVGFGDTVSQEEKQKRQDRVVEEIAKALPDSWIHHYITWYAGGNKEELFSHLERAYQLNPNDVEMARDFMVYYEMRGEPEKVKLFARKWYATGTMAPSLLDYNYNVLMSLDSNAVIFTDGDNDTYPLWLLQHAKGIRPDVTVLNTSLILNSGYLNWLIKERGLVCDPSLIAWDRFSTKSVQECTAEFIRSVATRTTKRPVYIGLTVDTSRISLIREDLYTVGLANRYSPQRIDNIAILKRNWKRFRMDYLSLQYNDDAYAFNRSWLPMLNMNYVTPAMMLYEHDLIAGDAGSAADLRRMIERIGLQGEQTEAVEEFIRGVDKGQGTSMVEGRDARESRLDEAKIFPNPSYNTLTLRTPIAADAELSTIGGTIVRQMRLEAGETPVDISDMPAGTYILRLSAGGKSITRTVKVIR